MPNAEPRICSKCGVAPAGEGGVLCEPCGAEIESQLARLYGLAEASRDEPGGAEA
jgi:hypothetical protein